MAASVCHQQQMTRQTAKRHGDFFSFAAFMFS